MDTLINLEEEFAHEYVLLRKSVTCSICLEIYQKPACLPCQHGFCESCITTALKVRDRCPICSAPAKKNKLKHINNLDETLELFRRLLSTIEQSLKIKRQQRITQQSAAFKAAANKSAPTAVSTATNNNNNDNASGKVQKLFTEEMPDLELTQHSSDSEGEEEALNMAVLSTQDSVEPEPPSVADPLPTQATKALSKRAPKAKAVEVPKLTLKDEISAPSGSKGGKRSKKRALDELLNETQAEQPLTATATATATAAVTTPAAPTRRDAAAAAANHSAAKNFVPFAAANATLSSTPVQPSTDPVAPFLRTTVFEKGALVNVLPRTWAGMNKIGGVGKVEHVRAMDAQEQPVDLAPLVAHGKHDDIACLRLYYKVKYVLDGHTDDDVPSAFVEKFEELSRERRRGSSNNSNNSTPGRLSSPPPSSTKAARGKAVSVAAVAAVAAGSATAAVSTDKENEGPVAASSVANAAATKKASKDAAGSGSKRKALQEKPKNSAASTTVAAKGETKPPPPKRIVTPTIEKVLNFDDDDEEEEEGDAPHGDAGRAATTKPTAATAVTTALNDDDDDDDNESLLAVLDLKHSATLPSSSSSTSLSSAVTVSKPPASTKKLLTMKKPTKGGAASAVAASAAAAADDTADKLSGHKRGRNLVLLTTCIDETKQSLAMLPSSVTSFEQALAHFTATHREVSAVTHFTSSVTHVVVSVDKQGIMKQRTMKYMQALAHGVWVVSTKWIYACLQAGAIVDESEYEVKSNIKALIPRAPMRARQMRLSKKSPGLFAGYVVVFFGLFPLPGPTRSDLEDIVRVQGAQRCFTQMADFWAYFQTMRRRSREASSSSSSSSSAAAAKSGLNDDYPTVVIVRSTAAASSGGSSSTAAAEEEAALLAMTSSNVGTSVDPDHDVYFAEEHGDNGGGGGGGGGGNDRQTLFDLERDRLRRYLATFPQVSALWIMDSVTNYEIQPFVAYAYKASSGSL